MSSLSKATVLVVDDELLVRMDLAHRLMAAGYRTCEASGAGEAIEMLERDAEIRVVFTDIQMPGVMDGMALSHYVRKWWPATIIVISSGNRTPREDEMPSESDFLPKPVGDGELRKLLDKVQRKLSGM